MTQPLRKVVFPVAGLGTRFLPATKVVAKEMLPVLDRPLIQYAVDEAVDAGADTLVFVTNRYKHAIADYFDKAYELEEKLAEKHKDELLSILRGILPRHVRCVFVTQPEALGLGDAVLRAAPVVGNERFGVMLPDDLIWNKTGPGALRQMAEVADANDAGVIAVEEVPEQDTDKYGIVDATEAVTDRATIIRHMVEKPKPADAPSNLAVVGRYVLPCEIFEYLKKTEKGAGGEIQLTDAIEDLLKAKGKVLAYRFAGTRFDCGNKAGLVRATMAMALEDPKLAPIVREFANKA
ncbi:UTP--glucose-1-phosphate uridylyltransferase GalU [Luteibacter sp. 9135]|jgi:UTP--glucose-1-phosphate uridylyltransferase|uniref:UTP--glucose-1-phosphate uridylyltransferase GalU n=1 Tax=Lysobacterales TaxID=135614 RepID=UPI000563C04B|nr:UTP--glucose-1-phosphate uridylyltransferase GalU [Luteibacter sp. 9135]